MDNALYPCCGVSSAGSPSERRSGLRTRCWLPWGADPLSPTLVTSGKLRVFRDHAVRLARGEAIRFLTELHQAFPQLELAEAQKRSNQVMQLLRRIPPGRTTHLQAIRLDDGSISAEPRRMAEALRSHWSKVFCHRQCHRAKLRQWLAEDLPRQAISSFPTPDDPILPRKTSRPPSTSHPIPRRAPTVSRSRFGGSWGPWPQNLSTRLIWSWPPPKVWTA